MKKVMPIQLSREEIRFAESWAWFEARLLMEEADWFHHPKETICLTPRGCRPEDHKGLKVVAVLAGEYLEGTGWLDPDSYTRE